MQLLPEAEMAAGAAVVFQDVLKFFSTFESRHRPTRHERLAAGPGYRLLSVPEVAVVPIWPPVESPCRADTSRLAPSAEKRRTHSPWRRISVICLAIYKPSQSADILCNNSLEVKDSGIIYIEINSEIGRLTGQLANQEARPFGVRDPGLRRRRFLSVPA